MGLTLAERTYIKVVERTSLADSNGSDEEEASNGGEEGDVD
jgi:hypothetical protein